MICHLASDAISLLVRKQCSISLAVDQISSLEYYCLGTYQKSFFFKLLIDDKRIHPLVLVSTCIVLTVAVVQLLHHVDSISYLSYLSSYFIKNINLMSN